MPRIFVPGPSVNPNFGSPSSFLANIQSLANSRRADRRASNELEQTRIFRQSQQELNERKQDFDEEASDRVRAEALFQREQSNARALSELGVIDAAGGSRVDPFLANEQTQKLFAEHGITDPAAQRTAVETFAGDNKALFSDPKVLSDTVYRGVLANKGTQAEATAAASRAVTKLFPTLDKDLAKSLLVKQTAGGSNKLFSGTTGSSKGSSTPLSGIPAQIQLNDLTKQFIEDYNITDEFQIPGTDFRPLDRGDHNLTPADVRGLQANFAKELRPETVLRALASLSDSSDGTSKIDPRKLTKDQRADFLLVGQAIEAKANEPRGGGGTLAGLSLNEIAALQKQSFDQTAEFNTNVIGRTSPQASTFEDRLSAFRTSLGTPDTTRQGGNSGGDTVVTPEVAAGVEATGSSTLDNLISPAPEVAASQTVQGPAEFNVGVPAGAEKVFNDTTNTISHISSAPGTAVGKLFESLTIPNSGINPAKQVSKANQEIQRELNKTRIFEIETELANMPAPADRTLQQISQAKVLETELRDLK